MNLATIINIISIFNFRDNALFLQNWRERTRSSTVISVTIVVTLVVGLLLTNAIINQEQHIQNAVEVHQNGAEKIFLPWQSKFLLDLAVLQGIVLLAFGTVFAYRMSARERQSGTLDFHRSSPTPSYNQIFGLTFGTTCLEWAVAFSLFALSCILIAITPHLSFLPYIQFFLGLCLCAYLYHCSAALLALVFSGYKKAYSGVILIFIFFYVFSHFIIFAQMSFGYHLTWLPIYEQFFIALKGVSFKSAYWQKYYELLQMQFGYKVPSFLFLLCAQVPFIGVFLSGIGRQIRKPEQPIFTKGQTLLLAFFILFLFTGSFFSGVLTSDITQRFGGWRLNQMLNIFFSLIVMLGVLGALNASPRQLSYLKGLRRMKKDLTFKLHSGDDQTTNVYWLGSFVAIVSIIMTFHLVFFKFKPIEFVTGLILLLSYIGFFAGFIEYFRLSKHYRKKAIFWTVLIILWILLPTLGFILQRVLPASLFLTILKVLSPFAGGIKAIATTFSPYVTNQPAPDIIPGTIVTFILAVITLYLAKKQRVRLWKIEMKDMVQQQKSGEKETKPQRLKFPTGEEEKPQRLKFPPKE